MRKYLLTAVVLSTLAVACNRPTEQAPQAAGEGQQPQGTQTTTTTPMEAGQTGAMQPSNTPAMMPQQQPAANQSAQPAMMQQGMQQQQPQAMTQHPAMNGSSMSQPAASVTTSGVPGAGAGAGAETTTTITTTTNPVPATSDMNSVPSVQQPAPAQNVAPQQQSNAKSNSWNTSSVQAAAGNRPTHGAMASHDAPSSASGNAQTSF